MQDNFYVSVYGALVGYTTDRHRNPVLQTHTSSYNCIYCKTVAKKTGDVPKQPKVRSLKYTYGATKIESITDFDDLEQKEIDVIKKKYDGYKKAFYRFQLGDYA